MKTALKTFVFLTILAATCVAAAPTFAASYANFDPMSNNSGSYYGSGYGYGSSYGYPSNSYSGGSYGGYSGNNYGVSNSNNGTFQFDENTWGALSMASVMEGWDSGSDCYSNCGYTNGGYNGYSNNGYSGQGFSPAPYSGNSTATLSGDYQYYDWRSSSDYNRYYYGNYGTNSYSNYGYTNYGDPYARYSGMGY